MKHLHFSYHYVIIFLYVEIVSGASRPAVSRPFILPSTFFWENLFFGFPVFPRHESPLKISEGMVLSVSGWLADWPAMLVLAGYVRLYRQHTAQFLLPPLCKSQQMAAGAGRSRLGWTTFPHHSKRPTPPAQQTYSKNAKLT